MTIGGALDDTRMAAVVVRVVRAVEGVVDVQVRLDDAHHVGPLPQFNELY